MKNSEKNFDFKLNKSIYIFFCLVFVVFNLLFLNNKMPNCINIVYTRKLYYFLTIFLTVGFEIIFCFLIYYFYDKKTKLEKIFLIIAIPLGLLFMILIPVGQVPDEHTHFERTYEIATGHLISSKNGRMMPVEINDNFISSSSSDNYSRLITNIFKSNSGATDRYVFANTSLYSFVCYIPQVIGVLIGRFFNASILFDAYLGRLFNFICWISLLYFSIKKIPFCKKSLILISLLPITLQEAVSLSPDSLTYSSIVFLISYTLFLTYGDKKVDRRDYILLSLMSIIISLCKIVYLPICLILFIIPNEKFKSMKDKNIKIIGLAFIVILINLVWLKIASSLLIGTQPGVVPDMQVKWILAHPIGYIKVILRTLFMKCDFYISSMFGASLQIFNVYVSMFYPFLSLILLIFMIVLEKYSINFIKNKERYLYIFIVISILLLIFTSLYIQWTPLYNSIIEGVQGRYFLPFLLLIPLIFLPSTKNKKGYNFNFLVIYVFALSIFSNINALMYIFFVN